MSALVDGDRRRGRGSFGGELGASNCNQWGLCDAALPPLLWAGLVETHFGDVVVTNIFQCQIDCHIIAASLYTVFQKRKPLLFFE